MDDMELPGHPSAEVGKRVGDRGDRDRHRADRWLGRHGGGLPALGPEAYDLLVHRLQARYRAAMVVSPLLVLAAGLMASAFLLGNDPDGWRKAFAVRFVACIVLMNVAFLLMDVVAQRSDRRLADRMPRRAGRERRVTVAEVVGARTFRAGLVTVVVEGVLGVVLVVVDHGGWPTWAFLVGLAAMLTSVAARLRRVIVRPTVAGDAVALAVDERLRGDDASHAVDALGLLMVAFGPAVAANSPTPSHMPMWFGPTWVVGYLVVLTAWTWAQLGSRWPGRIEPVADPVYRGGASL